MARAVEVLQVEITRRIVIEQARGILMVQQQCDAEAALAILVNTSRVSGTTLHDVASAIVASTVAQD